MCRQCLSKIKHKLLHFTEAKIEVKLFIKNHKGDKMMKGACTFIYIFCVSVLCFLSLLCAYPS